MVSIVIGIFHAECRAREGFNGVGGLFADSGQAGDDMFSFEGELRVVVQMLEGAAAAVFVRGAIWLRALRRGGD